MRYVAVVDCHTPAIIDPSVAYTFCPDTPVGKVRVAERTDPVLTKPRSDAPGVDVDARAKRYSEAPDPVSQVNVVGKPVGTIVPEPGLIMLAGACACSVRYSNVLLLIEPFEAEMVMPDVPDCALAKVDSTKLVVPVPVREDGLKTAVTPDGNPDALKIKAPLVGPVTVTASEYAAVLPAPMVCDAGVEVR